ncbi:unnamed protein product [Closterium sp. NIES-54]
MPPENPLRNVDRSFNRAVRANLLHQSLNRRCAGTDLSALAARSANFDEAMGNGRPTVVEFYADWCQVRFHHSCVVLTESHCVMLNEIVSLRSIALSYMLSSMLNFILASHLPMRILIIHAESIMALTLYPD